MMSLVVSKLTIMIILLVVLVLLVLLLLFVGYMRVVAKFYRKLLYRPAPMPKVDRSPTKINQDTVNGKGKNWFYSHRMEFLNVDIKAFDGTRLHAYFRPSSDRSAKFVVILLHGYNEHPSEMGAYARLLMSQVQCHVIIPHMRAHCMSGGKICTYGLYESVDLSSWIDWAKRQVGDDCRIFVMGRSMGATTALLAAQQEDFSPNVAGIIADCPMENLEKIALDIFRKRYNVNGKIFYSQVRKGAIAQYHFDLDYCDAAWHADRIKTPVLLFQGGNDTLTKPEGAKRIFDNLGGYKKMVIMDYAEHLMCYDKQPAKYAAEVKKFVEDCVVRLVKTGRM